MFFITINAEKLCLTKEYLYLTITKTKIINTIYTYIHNRHFK